MTVANAVGLALECLRSLLGRAPDCIGLLIESICTLVSLGPYLVGTVFCCISLCVSSPLSIALRSVLDLSDALARPRADWALLAPGGSIGFLAGFLVGSVAGPERKKAS
jgi:hypothetical protein